MNHEIKKEETHSEVTQRTAVENILKQVPVDELLGSVTTYPEGNDKNQSLRSSARVFKKIKLDANLNASSSTSSSVDKIEKKEEQKVEHTPQKDQKKPKPSWSAEDRVLFFEALNEYGKDFENIHTYIIQKFKKRGVPDHLLITKENVRHLYYKTWHKISKYLKFSEGTKKIVQELYGLINYGELRKKVGVFTTKVNHKLNELIYNGCVAIRVKGKMVRIKTPMCTALRRLNKLDDKDDDLKLPSRVLVELRPRDMSTFLKVQTMALNPRIRTILPLQKKLSTLITCISKKWRSAELEYLQNNFSFDDMVTAETPEEKSDLDALHDTSQLKFIPQRGVKVNIPKTNISEYFTRESVCLKAFEERMGIESSKYVLSLTTDKNKKPSPKSRADSFSENITKSPIKSEVQDMEKLQLNHTEAESTANLNGPSNNLLGSTESSTINVKPEEIKQTPTDKPEQTGDQLVDEALHNFFSAIRSENESTDNIPSIKKENDSDICGTPGSSKAAKGRKENGCLDISHTNNGSKTDDTLDNKGNKNISAEQLLKLDKIRNGWTVEDCDTLTIGELYLMFGSASKVVLEYYWVEKEAENKQDLACASTQEMTSTNEPTDSLKHNFGYTEALRKLVSMVKLQQKKIPPKCPCGHVCSPKNVVTKKSHNKSIGDIDEKTSADESLMEMDSSHPVPNGEEHKSKNIPFDDFLKPQSKPPPVQLMAQLDSIQKLKPKYSIRKGRRLRTTQLVVERELPLMPKASSGHQIVRMNIISQNSNSQSASNSEDHCEVDTQTTECETERFVGQLIFKPECGTHNMLDISSVSNEILDTDLNIAMEISEELPSGSGTTDNLSVFLQDSSRSMSPSGLLKENANWISSEVGDFSLSSFLGHLESPMKSQDDLSRDVDAQVRSLLTENSFDYTAKFADLANKVTSDTAN